MSDEQAVTILTRLGFTVEGSGAVRNVFIPSWRRDVEGSADLVEEIVRTYGYDNLPAVAVPLPENGISYGVLSGTQRRVSDVRRALAARGNAELVTWSFMQEAKAKSFGFARGDVLKLVNPISSDLDVMRPSILPNLLDALKRNADRGAASLSVFEIGPSFSDATPAGRTTVAAGLRGGEATGRNPHQPTRTVDVFDAKADLLAALEAAGAPVNNLQVERSAPVWYHPGRSGALLLGKTVLGYFGEIHPAIRQSFDYENNAVGFELFLDRLPQPKAKKSTAKPKWIVSDYQAVERDFAFLVDGTITASSLVNAARSADKALITDVRIFDVYQGKGIEPGKKSVAVAIRLQPTDRTLTDEEIETVSRKVIDAVATQCKAVLRG